MNKTKKISFTKKTTTKSIKTLTKETYSPSFTATQTNLLFTFKLSRIYNSSYTQLQAQTIVSYIRYTYTSTKIHTSNTTFQTVKKSIPINVTMCLSETNTFLKTVIFIARAVDFDILVWTYNMMRKIIRMNNHSFHLFCILFIIRIDISSFQSCTYSISSPSCTISTVVIFNYAKYFNDNLLGI